MTEFIINRTSGALSKLVRYTKLDEAVVEFATGRDIKTLTIPMRRLDDFVTAPRVGSYIRTKEDVTNVAEVLGYDLVKSSALVQYKSNGERMYVRSGDLLNDWQPIDVVEDDDIGSMTQRWTQGLDGGYKSSSMEPDKYRPLRLLEKMNKKKRLYR